MPQICQLKSTPKREKITFYCIFITKYFSIWLKTFRKRITKNFLLKKVHKNALFLKYATNMPICQHMSHDFSMKPNFEICHIYELWHINMPPGNSVPLIKKNRKSSFATKGIKLWNILPLEIKNVQSKKLFSTKVKEWIQTNLPI